MYGGYYGGGCWDCGDELVVGMMIGGVVGAAAASESEEETTTTTTTTNTGGLPCTPAVSVVEGVTYYQCGQQYYVEAYGGSGPIYMPVQPPGTPAQPPGG